MSVGGSGLLVETSLADLDLAWREREAEAAALVAAGFPAMALALRFYALEIRIKTVICRTLLLGFLPKHCKTHDLTELIIFTGLLAELSDPTNAAIRQNWDRLVAFGKDRLNLLRYLPANRLLGPDLAQLLAALDHPSEGVWTWLSRHP